jgi:hypothetical protein
VGFSDPSFFSSRFGQQAKLTRCLEAGDPDGEVDLAWQCYQQLRPIYDNSAHQGRRIAEKVIASFPTCPIPEVARVGRTLKAWRQQVLAGCGSASEREHVVRSEVRRRLVEGLPARWGGRTHSGPPGMIGAAGCLERRMKY